MKMQRRTLTPEEFVSLLREFLAEELKSTQTEEHRIRKFRNGRIVFKKKSRFAELPSQLEQPVG